MRFSKTRVKTNVRIAIMVSGFSRDQNTPSDMFL